MADAESREPELAALTPEELVTLPRMRLDVDRFDAFRADDVRVLLDIIDRLDRALRAATPRPVEGLRETVKATARSMDEWLASSITARFFDDRAAIRAWAISLRAALAATNPSPPTTETTDHE